MGVERRPRSARPRYPLPYPEEQRRITDVCCLIIGVLFGLIIFILACCAYNGDNLKRSNYPADSKGRVCMMDTQTGVNNYPFLYFNDLNDPTKERYSSSDAATAFRSAPRREYPPTATITAQ